MANKIQPVSLWKRLPYKGYVYASLFLSLLTVAVVLAGRSFLPPIVPLFYGRPVGEEQLVISLGLLIAPGISIFITILNVIVAFFINNTFFKKILIAGGFLVSLLVSITVIKIIFLVGFF